jgi:uncharacterized OB-fold protein
MSAERPVFTRCRRCGALAYLPRGFCKVCGGDDLAHETLAGGGTVSAVTVVHRAPSPELQALAPYALCLVEADEGVRLMARAAADLEIGERVTIAMTDFAGARVPHASPAPRADRPIAVTRETR